VLAVDADGEALQQRSGGGWPAADVLLVLPSAAGRYAGLAPVLTAQQRFGHRGRG
jgi:hypothetical protein